MLIAKSTAETFSGLKREDLLHPRVKTSCVWGDFLAHPTDHLRETATAMFSTPVGRNLCMQGSKSLLRFGLCIGPKRCLHSYRTPARITGSCMFLLETQFFSSWASSSAFPWKRPIRRLVLRSPIPIPHAFFFARRSRQDRVLGATLEGSGHRGRAERGFAGRSDGGRVTCRVTCAV